MYWKTVLLLIGFAGFVIAALWNPLYGVLGYVAEYSMGPTRQWYMVPIRGWGIRYSLTLAIATGIGILLHRAKLRYGRPLLTGQEWLMLLFLGIIWFSTIISEPTETQQYATVDHPSVKFPKLVIFVLMLTHVVTTERKLNLLLWVFVGAAFVLGVQAYTVPLSHFEAGRLETVGGPDFQEANFLAAFLTSLLPLIGIQFLRSGWPGKVFCLLSGVFATNAIILCRSRGALVGIAGGALVSLLAAPKNLRVMILIGMIAAAVGGYALTDEVFLRRAGTVSVSEEERDRSAQSRIEIWRASIPMLGDHPLGVGAGNFYQTIGRYDARLAGRDAHNTFVRCYGELGIPGIVVLAAVILTTIIMLRSAAIRAARLPEDHRRRLAAVCWGFAASTATALVSGFTISLLYTEGFWWLLMLPVCLERAIGNLEADLASRPAPALGRRPAL